MLIWGTIITALQAFGYSVALAGMVLYRLTWAEIRSGFAATVQSYRNAPKSESFDNGNSRVPRRFVVTAAVLLLALLILVASKHHQVLHLWSLAWFSESEDSGLGWQSWLSRLGLAT